MIDLKRQHLVEFEHVFTLKSVPELLKRGFDNSKIVFFQFTSKL